MKCKNCGALLHETDTFCRICATPVYESVIESNINLATSDFAKINKDNSQVKVVEKVDNKINNYDPVKDKNINNKDLLDKDPNNKLKATIINIGGLLLLLVIIFILIMLFVNIVSHLEK